MAKAEELLAEKNKPIFPESKKNELFRAFAAFVEENCGLRPTKEQRIDVANAVNDLFPNLGGIVSVDKFVVIVV